VWDYGPLGVELKRNIKEAWWKANVHQRDDMLGMDAAILMRSEVWRASGHLKSFADSFMKCPACTKFFRVDKIWDEIWNSQWFVSLMKEMMGDKDSSYLLKWAKKDGKKLAPNLGLVKYPEVAISWIADLHCKFGGVDLDFKNFIGRIACSRDGTAKTPCPNCGGPLPEDSMSANLMLETLLGPVKETAQKVYLRPETAQGMFVNFANALTASRKKLPFGMAQIGKSFRNEITTKNFIFRTREFEQMEIEYFVRPKEADAQLEKWIEERFNWYVNLGIARKNLRKRPHSKQELAHYAKACTDIEYNFPFGWSELEGIANRTDFDLKQHAKLSGKDLRYFDEKTKERFYPYIIEPSGGVDRTFLAFLADAYREDEVKGKQRAYLSLKPDLAPLKAAVLPLLKNRPEIVEMAKKITDDLKTEFSCMHDDTAAIGKLYRRQDEVGTPFCVTVDVQSLEDKKVTVRERDTMKQERISAAKIRRYLKEGIS